MFHNVTMILDIRESLNANSFCDLGKKSPNSFIRK